MKIQFQFSLQQLHAVIVQSKQDPEVLTAFRNLAAVSGDSESNLATAWLRRHDSPPTRVCQAGMVAWHRLCEWVSACHVELLPENAKTRLVRFSLVRHQSRLPGDINAESLWALDSEASQEGARGSVPVMWERLLLDGHDEWSVAVVDPRKSVRDFFLYFREADRSSECLAYWSWRGGQFTIYGEISGALITSILS